MRPEWFDAEESANEDWNEAWEDDTDTVSCPECGSEVYEDALYCPTCGSYITIETSAWQGKPWWWVVLGVLGISAVIWSLTWF